MFSDKLLCLTSKHQLVLQCDYWCLGDKICGGQYKNEKNKLNNISLKKKLIIIYLIVSTIPIMSLGYFLTSQLYVTTLNHDISLTISSHKQLQDNFINVFRSNSGVLNGLLADPSVMNYVETYYEADYLAINDFRTFISLVIRRTNRIWFRDLFCKK